MAIYCGVDIVEVERIKNSIEEWGSTFRDKIFTRSEIDYCEARKKSRYLSYAARFAAKEAVSKALGTGISGGIQWLDIEIVNDELGKPFARLTGKAHERFLQLKGVGISVSLSHSKSLAIAYAVLEAEENK